MAYAEPEHLDERALERLNPDLDTPDRKSRVEAAVALRVAGANYSEIAEVLEYGSVTQARSAVERGLAATVSEEDRKEQREIAGRRLERVLRGLYNKATDPEHPEHLSAARTALAYIDRHIRLYGLDAPSEMVVYSPAASEIEQWIADQVRASRAGLPQEVDILDVEVIREQTPA